MKKRIIFILMSLCVCVGLFAQAQFDFKSELKKANAGDATAQCNVGFSYYLGDNGAKRDYSAAFMWFMRASEQGLSDAQYGVGVCYFDGKGVTQNYSEAFKWYKKAAEGGCAIAQSALGICYDNGHGTKKDVSEAIRWYKPAAEKGIPAAQLMLGFHYFEGTGVEKNYSEAYNLLSPLAEKGIADAQYVLGLLYGENDDKDNATKWLTKAAAQNNVNAKNALQYLHDYGTLKKEDIAVASTTENSPQNGATSSSQTGSNNTVVAQTTTSGSQQPETKVETIKSDVDVNIPKTLSTNDKTFAVVIANEKYSREVDVPYALNDGGRFAEYCTSALGVPETNVHLVENATLNDLRHEVGWITQVMNAYNGEAKVIFYYAGHGIPDESSKSALLLPVDGYGSDVSSGYPLGDLYAALNEAPSQSVTVFLDACFSGAKREGDMMASARGVAIKVNATTPKGNMVVFSAAQGDETAYPYTEKGHGLFTYYLLKKLQDTGGNVTLGDLSDYVTEQVSRQSIVINSKSQTPTVIPSANMSELWRSEKVK